MQDKDEGAKKHHFRTQVRISSSTQNKATKILFDAKLIDFYPDPAATKFILTETGKIVVESLLELKQIIEKKESIKNG